MLINYFISICFKLPEKNFATPNGIKFAVILTLHLHLTHLISPCEWIRGCHSIPFSYGPPRGYLQPPEASISSAVRLVDNAAWSRGKRVVSPAIAGLGVVAGHCLQHAFLPGRKANFSSQSNGGHCTRGHFTSSVTCCKRQTAISETMNEAPSSLSFHRTDESIFATTEFAISPRRLYHLSWFNKKVRHVIRQEKKSG